MPLYKASPIYGTYTPIVTPSVGTYGSITATGKYCINGKLATVTGSVAITNIGTATGVMSIQMPKICTVDAAGMVIDDFGISGGGVLFHDQGYMSALRYNGNTAWVQDHIIFFQITYFI